jgi:hypothetical protein
MATTRVATIVEGYFICASQRSICSIRCLVESVHMYIHTEAAAARNLLLAVPVVRAKCPNPKS